MLKNKRRRQKRRSIGKESQPTSSNGNEALEAAAEERQRQTSNVVPGHTATDLNARFASVRRDNEYILSNRKNLEQQPTDHSKLTLQNFPQELLSKSTAATNCARDKLPLIQSWILHLLTLSLKMP